MSLPFSERFLIGTLSYMRVTDLSGNPQGLEPSVDYIMGDDDPDSCAQVVVDLACENSGIVYQIFDSVSQDHIAIYHDGETREELLASAREAMRKFDQDEADEQPFAHPE